MPRLDWNRHHQAPIPSPNLPRLNEVWPAGSPTRDNLRLYHADNLTLLQAWPEPINLVYIDPPFATGREWNLTQEPKLVAYRDSGWGGIDGYLSMLEPRLRHIHRVLAPNGSLWVHLDYRVQHYVRLLLEEIFGPEALVNEIIWHYASGGGSLRRFGRKHDTLLWFAKGPDYTFNADAVRVPYKASIAKSRRSLFHQDGMVCPDVWEISRGKNGTQETPYPTEKPRALLERLIDAASNPGDLVADFFAGSGTTGICAIQRGRRAVLCDESPVAINCMRRRFNKSGLGFTVYSEAAHPCTGAPSIGWSLGSREPNGSFTIHSARWFPAEDNLLAALPAGGNGMFKRFYGADGSVVENDQSG
jgi:DNA modification methylase